MATQSIFGAWQAAAHEFSANLGRLMMKLCRLVRRTTSPLLPGQPFVAEFVPGGMWRLWGPVIGVFRACCRRSAVNVPLLGWGAVIVLTILLFFCLLGSVRTDADDS